MKVDVQKGEVEVEDEVKKIPLGLIEVVEEGVIIILISIRAMEDDEQC